MHRTGPLILASASPRRAKLLREAGYRFEQFPPPFDDSGLRSNVPPDQFAAELARRKAESVVARVESAGAIVLGCDTLLSVNGRIEGKPADCDCARGMLRELFSQAHLVLTAVCLIDVHDNRRVEFVDECRVSIDAPSESEFEAYLLSEEWRGKAGGYNLAELEGRWQFHVEGDPTTVIGLPMRRLEQELRRFAPDLLPEHQ